MNLSGIDWIWRIRGSIAVEPMQSPAAAFDKLDPLFREQGTSYRIDGDTLRFTKKDQLPQDKMSVFDHGTLRISNGVLRYDMMSRALLACFLAPLLFFAVGHIGVALDTWRNPPELAAAKEAAEKKRSRVKPEDVPMNPIDEFLGAAKPEKEKEKKKEGEEVGKRKRKPSMTTAYVFMGIFFALWVLGRILENVLIHKRLRKLLAGESLEAATDGRASAYSDHVTTRLPFSTR